jgi:CBS domain-containing protein
MGFGAVHDYAAGKVDWLAHGLPVEGEEADAPRAGQLARADAATCALDERVGEVRPRVDASPYGFAVAVGAGGVVLGRLRAAALAGDPSARVGDVVEPGPATVRPSEDLGPLLERMRRRGLPTLLVTTPEGVLIGVLRRDDVANRMARPE